MRGIVAVLAALALAAPLAVRAEDGCPPPARAEASAPAGDLSVSFHGVSTLMFSDGKDRLLIDGFFSRPGRLQTLFLPIGSKPSLVKQGLGDGPAVRAVLTAHAHHDHALDVAGVAEAQREAIVVGTPSVIRLAEARGVPPGRTCIPQSGKPMVFGPYTVEAVEVAHGRNPRLLERLLNHPLERDLGARAWFGSYKDNANLSYLITYGRLRILVHPSAGPPPAPLKADVVFLGMGRVSKMEDKAFDAYWRATVSGRTRTLVPIHWDNFTTKLGTPLKPPPKWLDDVDAAMSRLCRTAGARRDLEVLRMDAGGRVTLSQAGVAIPGVAVSAPCGAGAATS